MLKYFLYHNLTDTESTSLIFGFICEVESDKKRRGIQRFDIRDNFKNTNYAKI